jgi:hypothetical protein
VPNCDEMIPGEGLGAAPKLRPNVGAFPGVIVDLQRRRQSPNDVLAKNGQMGEGRRRHKRQPLCSCCIPNN